MTWGKNGTETLVSSANDISKSILNTTFNIFLYHVIGKTATATLKLRLGSTSLDSGSNYAYRGSADGGADATAVSQSSLDNFNGDPSANIDGFSVGYFINISTEEKLLIYFSVLTNTAGAGTAPSRRENTGKWANTTNQADIIGSVRTAGTGQQDTDTNLTDLGTD